MAGKGGAGCTNRGPYYKSTSLYLFNTSIQSKLIMKTKEAMKTKKKPVSFAFVYIYLIITTLELKTTDHPLTVLFS